MKRDPSVSSERDERLNRVLAAYLEAAEAGRAPDRQELLARHADLAAELAGFFENQDRMRALVQPPGPTVVASQTDTSGGAGPGSELRAGSRFGDYDIIAEIARGGMGVVFRARHTALNRVVALKMVLAQEMGATAVRRFRMEAEAAATLDHPHIVPIYEVGERDGQPYFTMKLIDGSGLNKQVSRFVNDQRAAARLLAVVARAVHHAHQRGILHRDLKPANILLDARGQPHVTDFGLAKRLTEPTGAPAKPDLTRMGAVLGTASYMAPEQAMGKNHALTTAADVYALGAILYELLTGRPPFQAETFIDTLLEVVKKEPVPPRSLNRRADPDLQRICLKCLEKEPTQRYVSAAALADDLEHWSAGEAISLRPAGRLERLRKWCRKNPRTAALSAALLLCLSVVVVGSPVALFRIDAERRETEKAAIRLEATNGQLEATNGRLAEANSRLKEALANESRARGETTEQREKLRQQLVRRYVGSGAQLQDDGDWSGALVWFAEALRLEQKDPERAALHRLRLGQVLERCPKTLQIWYPEHLVVDAAFSPDGQRLYTLDQDGVARVWAVGAEKAVRQFAAGIRQAVFNRDGSRLLAVHAEGKARLWDTAAGKPIHEFAHGGVTCATFSPEAAWAVTAGKDGTARVWDLANLRQPARQTPSGPAIRFAAVGPGGRLVITTLDSETVWWLWQDKAKTRPGYAEIKRVAAGVQAAAIGKGDKPILTIHKDLHLAHAWSLAGRTLERKPEGNCRFRGELDACFNPQKGLMLMADGPVAQAWDATAGKLVGPRLVHARDVIYAGFSQDGTRVVTVGADRTARVWDADTGQPLTPPLLRPAMQLLGARFSLDGRHLVLLSNSPKTALLHVLEIPEAEAAYHKPDSRPWGARALLSVDGRLAVNADQANVQLWETASARPLVPSLKCSNPVTQAFSPDGRRVLIGDPATLHIGQVGNGKVSWTAVRPGGELKQAAFSADGTRVVALSRRKTDSADKVSLLLESWDATTGHTAAAAKEVQRESKETEMLSPDGRLLGVRRAIAARIDLVDLSTGKKSLLGHNARVNAMAFGPDGRHLVTACVDRTAQVWDTASGEPVAALVPLGEPVLGTVFRGDGRLLATVHAREGDPERGVAVRVWDTATWQPVTPLLPHDKVQSAAFSPDGRSLITTAAGGVRVWDLRPTERSPEDLVKEAEWLAGRGLRNGDLMPLDPWLKVRKQLNDADWEAP